MTLRIIFISLFSVLSLLGRGEDRREWRDSTGSKSFMGDYIRVEGSNVFIKKDGLDEISLPIKRLHRDDILWLKDRVKRDGPAGKKLDSPVFDDISFGDSRDVVLKKIQKSKIVVRDRKDDSVFSSDNAFSGMYKTKENLGGLCFRFYCEWEGELLSQIDLKSEGVRYSQYPEGLEAAWAETAELLGQIYGEPVKANPALPPRGDVESGASVVGTHKWKLDNGAEIVLGAAHDTDDNKPFLLVRIYE